MIDKPHMSKDCIVHVYTQENAKLLDKEKLSQELWYETVGELFVNSWKLCLDKFWK